MIDLPQNIVTAQERARKIREESAKIEAERAAQEAAQQKRSAMHEEQARQAGDDFLVKAADQVQDQGMREAIWARIMEMRKEAEPKPAMPVVPQYTPRQQAELELEQAAGRRALEKYAAQNNLAREARARISVEDKAKEENAERKRVGHTTPVYVDKDFIPGFKF